MASKLDATVSADVAQAEAEAAEAQQLLAFAERRANATLQTLTRRKAMSTITTMIDEAPDSLRRIARALRRGLETKVDEHAHAKAGLHPAGKRAEIDSQLADARGQANGVLSHIVHEIQEAERLGQVPAGEFVEALKPVQDLVYAILGVEDLDAAEELVAAIRNTEPVATTAAAE